MRQSQLFTRTRREAPKDEVAKNAQLLIRAGFIHKEQAGVYSYLPLGLRVLNKIIAIIREEMNGLGGEEVALSALQEKETWEPTNQWSDEQVDVWFKTNLKSGTELGLAVTHEAALTKLLTNFIASYRDLPRAIYQFQTKFRNEQRAKSGLLRCREFLMKDLYSFARSAEEHQEFYERVKAAYGRIFNQVGLGEQTYLTFASGGIFGQFSHEFQTLTEAGEDTIYVDEEKKLGVNLEVATPEVLTQLGMVKESLLPRKAIEVGNIFSLGTRFSTALGLSYRDETGVERPAVMGSYGIGPGRVLGAITEVWADNAGLVWPSAVAPFAIHLVELPSANGEVRARAEAVYQDLTRRGIETLWDDRDLKPGEKFADSDLLGLPTRIIISEKTLGENKFEVKDRRSGEIHFADHV